MQGVSTQRDCVWVCAVPHSSRSAQSDNRSIVLNRLPFISARRAASTSHNPSRSQRVPRCLCARSQNEQNTKNRRSRDRRFAIVECEQRQQHRTAVVPSTAINSLKQPSGTTANTVELAHRIESPALAHPVDAESAFTRGAHGSDAHSCTRVPRSNQISAALLDVAQSIGIGQQ